MRSIGKAITKFPRVQNYKYCVTAPLIRNGLIGLSQSLQRSYEKERFRNMHDMNSSRRDFIKRAGIAAAGLLVAPYLKPSGIYAYGHKQVSSYLATVAITNTINTPADIYVYDDAGGGVKQKVQYLFDQLGGISDLFSSGKKVVIKINLTGGSGNATNSKLNEFL